MRILFDHGVPAPLRRALTAHAVSTAHEMGWNELDNGALLKAAEASFDTLVTTDQNLRHQQNLSDRRLAILVLPTTSWSKIQTHERQVIAAIDALRPGEVVELTFSQAPPL
jgi:predicted nuclease of predicted toxin-antitoxin system